MTKGGFGITNIIDSWGNPYPEIPRDLSNALRSTDPIFFRRGLASLPQQKSSYSSRAILYHLPKLVSEGVLGRNLLFDWNRSWSLILTSLLNNRNFESNHRKWWLQNKILLGVEQLEKDYMKARYLEALANIGRPKGIKKIMEVLTNIPKENLSFSDIHRIFSAADPAEKAWSSVSNELAQLAVDRGEDYSSILLFISRLEDKAAIKSHLPVLKKMLKSKNKIDSLIALKSLTNSFSEDLIPLFKALSKDKNPHIKFYALKFLAEDGDKEALEKIDKYMLSPLYAHQAYSTLVQSGALKEEDALGELDKELSATSRANSLLHQSYDYFPDDLVLFHKDVVFDPVNETKQYAYLYKYVYKKGKQAIHGLVFINPHDVIWQTSLDKERLVHIGSAFEWYEGYLRDIHHHMEINDPTWKAKLGRWANLNHMAIAFLVTIPLLSVVTIFLILKQIPRSNALPSNEAPVIREVITPETKIFVDHELPVSEIYKDFERDSYEFCIGLSSEELYEDFDCDARIQSFEEKQTTEKRDVAVE